LQGPFVQMRRRSFPLPAPVADDLAGHEQGNRVQRCRRHACAAFQRRAVSRHDRLSPRPRGNRRTPRGAKHKWTEVDPAIFGTLLEQALIKTERRRLGAHYTPRAYVQRLVEVTVMELLREDWRKTLTKAQAAKDESKDGKAIAILRAFLHYLC